SQGLELAAECHLAKIVQCAHLMQAPKYTPEELANLSSACFKLNSMQLGALLRQYKGKPIPFAYLNWFLKIFLKLNQERSWLHQLFWNKQLKPRKAWLMN